MKEKISLLIVDDHINQLKTMAFILESKGYAVTVASSGQEAIDLVAQKRFSIIFLDIKMPIMDGVETYKKIKQVRPDTVVIMMTAYAMEDLVQEALNEGAYDIIYKPLDINKVISTIEEVRKRNGGALVLVVDDDSGTCITFKNILVRRNYSVGIAHTGEEAIHMAKQHRYEIIFIDMKLPTVNGLETYLQIRKENPEAVAVMMTAYRHEMTDLVEDALSHSAYTCIYKPLDMTKILQLIEEIIDKKNELIKVNGNERLVN